MNKDGREALKTIEASDINPQLRNYAFSITFYSLVPIISLNLTKMWLNKNSAAAIDASTMMAYDAMILLLL